MPARRGWSPPQQQAPAKDAGLAAPGLGAPGSIAVSVNVVIWLIVSVTTAEFIYPWPLWVAGPWGAVLLRHARYHATAGRAALRPGA